MEPDSLGGRIRRLRSERGLSLAQVAGEDFSRAFLHQIELGNSRPSIRMLRVIAGKLGAPVEFLLEGEHPSLDQQVVVEQARIALARGRPARAVEMIEPLQASQAWPVGSDARLTLADALMRLGRRERAEELLSREEASLRNRADSHRLERLAAIRGVGPAASGADGHLRRAERALRRGETAAALEHYRIARVLYEERKED